MRCSSDIGGLAYVACMCGLHAWACAACMCADMRGDAKRRYDGRRAACGLIRFAVDPNLYGRTEHMNILVLGSGGREHAIVKSVAESRLSDEVFVAPGNGGTAQIAQNVQLDQMDARAVAEFCKLHSIGLCVIGPEAPLVAGVADVVRAAGVAVFGPGSAGARLEGSKQFSKDLMVEAGIPTARYGVFEDAESAMAYLAEHEAPIVVKADGLAAGKGVVVAATNEEAAAAVSECFSGKFGQAGSKVVIEECMRGPECSLLAFTDGQTVRPMAAAQDHKRALEGDKGPNTGGMGVYSPVPIVTDEEHATMVEILEKTVAALRERGIDYRGVLYGGFMLTAEGPKVLEFNARFGDPETQVLLPRLKTDLVEVMLAVANKELRKVELEWDLRWAVSVVLASAGYPGPYEKGYPIGGIDAAAKLPDTIVYHAGTKLSDSGTVLTNGGRVLNVTSLGTSFDQARNRAYEACGLIEWEGVTYRTDIGARAMRGRDAWEI